MRTFGRSFVVFLASLCAAHAFAPQATNLIPVKHFHILTLPRAPIVSPTASIHSRTSLVSINHCDLPRYQLTRLHSTPVTGAEEPLPRLDQILSRLTSLFPLFVLGSAILGSYIPSALNWVNRGNYISLMLAG